LHACPPKASLHSPWPCQKRGTSTRMRPWPCQLVGGPFTTFLVRGFSLCSSSKPNGTPPLILSGSLSSSHRRLLFIDTAYARPSLCWAPHSTTPGMFVVVGRILAHRRLQTSGIVFLRRQAGYQPPLIPPLVFPGEGPSPSPHKQWRFNFAPAVTR
jgi:hypothetical protein